MSPIQPMRAHVTQITNDAMTVTTSDGQTWRLPLTAVAGTPSVGAEIRLIGMVPGSEDAGKTDFAATLLNELLNPAA